MSEPVNIKVLRLTAEIFREMEAPFKAAGDHRGLGVGAAALAVAAAADEIEHLRSIIESVARVGDPGIARGAINWKR